MNTAIFDLGNVLVYFSHERMFDQIAALYNQPSEQVRQMLLNEGWGIQLERGQITDQQLFDEFERRFHRKIPLEQFKLAFVDIFWPNQSLEPIIHKIKKNKIRLVLLSNTSQFHWEYIWQKYPVVHLFDEFVLSYQVKAAKPEEAIFRRALEAAKCPPEECFYTDDVEAYVEAAGKLGIPGLVYSEKVHLLF